MTLTIRRRLILAVSIFLFPIAVFGFLYLSHVNEGIQTAAKEIRGVEYLKSVWNFILSANQASVKLDVGSKLKKSIVLLKQESAIHDEEMGSQALSSKLFRALERHDLSDPKLISESELDRFVELSLVLFEKISDASGITLDPDLDTYYIGDVVTQKASILASALHDIREIADQMRENPGRMSADQIRLITTIEKLRSGYQQMHVSLVKGIGGYADPSETAALKRIFSASKDQAEIMLGLATAIHMNIAFTSDMEANLREIARRAEIEIGDFDVNWSVPADELKRLLEVRITRFYQSATLPLIVAIGIFLAALVFAAMMANRILKALTSLTATIDKASAGDVAEETPMLAVKTEIGDIARAVERLKQSTVTRLTQSNRVEREEALKTKHRETMALAAAEIRTSTAGLIQDLRAASVLLEATTTSVCEATADTQMQMGDTTATLKETVKNIDLVASSSEEFAMSIAEITRQTASSSKVADEVKVAGETVQGCVERLSETAERIGHIVTLISKISSQTNLLALNATIEAARAGEAGRGFSVVAGEVKQLAAQTAKATNDVGAQISTIKAAVADVAATVKVINEVVARSNTITITIATSIQQQSTVSDDIGENVRKVALQTEIASRAVDDVASLAAETGDRVKALQTMSTDLKIKAADLERQVDSALSLMAA